MGGSTRIDGWRLACLAGAALLAGDMAGCQAPRFGDGPRFWQGPAEVVATPAPEHVRALPMFDGHDGTPVGWHDMIGAIAWADVIVIGEQHDDGVGHAVQRAVVEDTMDAWWGSTLAMEMLERDEQPIVDDYAEGIIDAERFAKRTFSTNWGAKGKWPEWYQPIVDAALERGGFVVAANAPRRYVRLARTDGYDRLAQLPSERRRWVVWPRSIDGTGDYYERFRSIMSGGDRPEAPGEEDARLSDEQVRTIFRSQLVWDTTMADSTARAYRPGRKVVLLVGQFHSDFEGGTVQEIRRRAPAARVVVISLRRNWPDSLLDDDLGRADIVVYTGERPPEEEEEEEEAERSPEADPNDVDTEDEAPATSAPPTSQPDDSPTSQPEDPAAS